MKNKIYITLLTLSSILTFVGCNKSSDALSDYKGLVIAPKTDAKSDTQSYEYDPFIIKISGSNDENNGNFIEGESGQVLIKVETTSPLVTEFDLVVSHFNFIEQLMVAKTEVPGVFSIQWTPQVGFIAPLKNHETIEIKVRARVLSEGALKAQVSKEQSFTLNVNRENRQPKILGYSGLSKGIDEGALALKFTVDIDDPSSLNNGVPPELPINSYQSNNVEGFRANARPYIDFDNSQKENPKQNPDGKGKSTWRYYFVLDVPKMPVKLDRLNQPDQKADSVQLCFDMEALSFNGSPSVKQQVCLEGRYSAQTPTLTWLESQVVDVNAKEQVSLKFEAKSVNGLGVITTPSAQQLAALIGTREISCQNTEATLPSQKVCEIKWTPPCVKTAQTVKLNFKVDNKLANKSKNSEILTRSFTIHPNEVACPAPVKKPSIKPAAKPATKVAKTDSADKKETK